MIIIILIIVIMLFVDREKALSILQESWESKENFLVIYGRRRIGKSRLIKEFLKRITPDNYIYFLASRRPIRYNLEKLTEKISALLNASFSVNDFVSLFRMLVNIVSGKRFLVVIDEFTYLIEADRGIVSDFQEIVDDILEGSNVKLILIGSLVGMMEQHVLGAKSPLYGRANRIIKLPPLDLEHLVSWFGKADLTEIFKIYAVTNGVPKYLEFFRGENTEDEIIRNFFDNSSFLFRDAIELLKEELREPTNYILILEAIANGMTKLSEISNYTYIEPTKLMPYISTLRSLGIVRREVPLLAPKKARRGIYTISDMYFQFWFRFVSPYYEEIENEEPENAIVNFQKNFNTYLGIPFETYARKKLRRVLRKRGYRVDILGRWWTKNIDIDIVAIDNKNRKIVFCEVKWKELSLKETYRILAKLEAKAEMFPHKKDYSKEYCIVTKKFREKLTEALLIDLKDLIISEKQDRAEQNL